MDGSKSSEGNVAAHRLNIFGISARLSGHRIQFLRLEAGAERVRLTRAPFTCDRRGDSAAASGDDAPVDARDWYFVAGLGNDVFRLSVKRGIRFLQELIGRLCGLGVRPLIDETTDGHAARQLRH